MSFTTILGIMVGLGLFIGSIFISTDNYLVFLSLSSALMVVGGTLAATFIAYEARYVLLALRLIFKIFRAPQMGRGQLTGEVGRVVKWGYLLQKKGINALEQEAERVGKDEPFLGWAMEVVITGYDGEETAEMLHNAIDNAFSRNLVPVAILKSMAAAAPAFGMIGTLVGLVIMLDKMADDPTSLGAGLAIALITTLYGIVAARFFFLPAASKIQQREEIMRFRNYLIAEGLIMLADRKGPRAIQDRMNSFLDPAIHFNIDKSSK
ncbi:MULTISPECIES: motility protein A [Thalassospira]|jgi:chemotaxis protein MotA|uniref:Flagellar motor protein MotA n=2 Tax=Thalassospira tepidiphila TaxID=393657 RepID=A0A853L1K0_9PROT|nr:MULTISPECIES: MotA/TolQ/ExbB proton channel family protein [Thalassospira]KXJ55759.1 MAG: flagellar motor protein MotA [Thalassospira sp. Nap_22]KZC98137.1 flagellar motor protein MotA [Thalassospira sp. MCCC 1A02898]MBO6580122.1 MotA/TolQ/ExbB proton channel family protein [Thalassospira sp.]MBO6804710.1 MotA/TolQ/ExbB proton channel family protein [Thalassospira sp.]MBO6820115.1 MotA/TolQ/ExbB proton channel family protein [Thalassospira sp.]